MPLLEDLTPRSKRSSAVQKHGGSGRNTAVASSAVPRPPVRLVRRDSTFQHLPRAPKPSLAAVSFDAFRSTSSEQSDADSRTFSVTVCPFDSVQRKLSPRPDHLHKKLTIWEKGKQFGKLHLNFH